MLASTRASGAAVPQVFVSYARADKRAVTRLVSALRRSGFEPWWDDDIPAGASWEITIERALAEAEAVIVCWSPASVASENVRSEARVARSRGRLVQVFIEPCEAPLFFGERQGIDLADWNGSARGPKIERLKHAVQDILSGLPIDGSGGRNSVDAPPRMRRRRPSLLLGGLLGLTGIVGVGWWWLHGAPAQASKVVVMAIKGLGGSPGLQAVADGLVDQINASLVDGHIPTISNSLTGSEFGQQAQFARCGLHGQRHCRTEWRCAPRTPARR